MNADGSTNCTECWHLRALHDAGGCSGKVYPAHSLDGEPCPCRHATLTTPGSRSTPGPGQAAYDPLRCPACGSPQPSLHPAVSGGGEVTRLCTDPFHGTIAAAAPAGQPSPEVIRAAFRDFLASQGYEDNDRFDQDEMELAFETGMYVQAAAPAGTGAPGLRKALEGLVNFWAVGGNGIDATSKDLISACSAELLRVLNQHPEQPQPAPESAVQRYRREAKERLAGRIGPALAEEFTSVAATTDLDVVNVAELMAAAYGMGQDARSATQILREALEAIAAGAQASLDSGIGIDRNWIIEKAMSAVEQAKEGGQ